MLIAGDETRAAGPTIEVVQKQFKRTDICRRVRLMVAAQHQLFWTMVPPGPFTGPGT